MEDVERTEMKAKYRFKKNSHELGDLQRDQINLYSSSKVIKWSKYMMTVDSVSAVVCHLIESDITSSCDDEIVLYVTAIEPGEHLQKCVF